VVLVKVVKLVVNVHWPLNVFVNFYEKLAVRIWAWNATFFIVLERCFLNLVTLNVKRYTDGQKKRTECCKDSNRRAERWHGSPRGEVLLLKFIS
jgi:hypothetical protein